LKYWGKSERLSETCFHPLACHGLDAAALAWTLLASDRLLSRRFERLLGLPPQAVAALISFLVGLHDLGKFSPRFQALRPELFQRLQGRECRRGYLPHTRLGAEALNRLVTRDWLAEGWFGLGRAVGDDWYRREFLAAWCPAAAGHHGQPVAHMDKAFGTLFEAEDQAAVGEFTRDLGRLLGLDQPWLAGWDLPARLDGLRKVSWLLAGLIVLCDWLASNEELFPYADQPQALTAYWPVAQERAQAALAQAGLLAPAPASFAGVHELFPTIASPRPLQQHVAYCDLPPGPALYILEDATGSGKTEAALALAQRIMSAGEAEGLFLALPTMATANAMFGRMGEVYWRLFSPGSAPALVLAHSQKRLVLGYASLLEATPEARPRGEGENEDSQAQSAAWLADSNKKSLLAAVGVGTLDQALMAALPVKHQALRLLGLGRSLLIADEVHAYDPYTTEVLAGLLRFQAGLGGSAILLSATLPLTTRRRLATAFAAGLGQDDMGQPESLAYPLATTLHAGGLREEPVPLAAGSSREIKVSLLAGAEVVMERLVKAAQAGACACWIRNTVDDALAAYRELVERLGPERVELFHARLAMCDRLEREELVLRRFGKDSRAPERTGQILIATQVVEQSLDLDFDLLASDLAPVDLMIQRAGRLHRHARSGRPLAQPELLVLAPPPVADAPRDWYRAFLPKAAFVYRRPGQLWLTASLLAASPRLRLPERARELVEGVFGDEAQEMIPPALRDIEEAEEGRESGERSLGRLHCLLPEEGYKPGGDVPWDEDTPTRLGPPSVMLRLARWENGVLRPWAAGEGMRAWSLSQARVRRSLVAGEYPAPEPALAAAIREARAGMADQGAHTVLIALEPGQDGAWEGRAVNTRQEVVKISYHQATGVDIY
jgi:CRISPR-associated endonuclease/helicase Cas3